MVVEDNVVNHKVIAAFLSKLGAKIQIYENGELAVQAIKQGVHADLIFMDVQMPVMDGLTRNNFV